MNLNDFLVTVLSIDFILGIFEHFSIILLGIVFGCTLLLAILRVLMIIYRAADDEMNAGTISAFPFISIHIPCCNEPPEMVINTIKSCLRQQYPRFEIIVLSNNTKKRELWQPVEAFCKKYPEKIRFQNHSALLGYKAGALDICRNLSQKNCDYLFTVDADYELKPMALRKAIGYLADKNAQVLQFPQSYAMGSTMTDGGLREELYSYFELYSKIGNLNKNALPTGTLSLIEVKCLDEVNGWMCSSITEDADLGIKMRTAGYNTCFVPEILGHGRLPDSITDLFKQRSRWIFGNFQSLKTSLKTGVRFNLPELTIFLQLTAWLNLLFFPIIYLVVQIVVLSLFGGKPDTAFFLAIACVFLSLLGEFIILGFSTKFYGKIWIDAFLTRTALTVYGAFQWIPALLGFERPFECTDKFKKKASFREIPMVLPALFLVLSIITILQGSLLVYPLLFLFVLFTAASIKLYEQFRPQPETLNVQIQKS